MTGEPFPDRFRRWYRMLPPAVRVLLTVNTVLYVAWVLLRILGLGSVTGFVVQMLALHPEPPGIFLRPWQVLTYAFLHVQPGLWGFIAFAFHMLWLYWLGREYEELYGGHRLFGMYVLSALGGALLAIGAAAAIPGPGAGFPVAGAMGAVLGVICAIATLNPDRGIGLLIIGVVPMKWIAIGFLAISVLFAFGQWTYMAVYLGGAGTGYVFARAQQNGRDLAAWARGLFPRAYSPYGSYGGSSEPGLFKRVGGWVSRRPGSAAERDVKTAPARRGVRSRTAEAGATEGNTVDRLLDKINERGYDALSDEEKQILYEASRKG